MMQVEQAAIQAALLDNDGAMQTDLGPEHFSTTTGETLWQEITKALTMNGAADGVGLQSALANDRPALEALGECMTMQASASQLGHYAEIIRRESRRRQIKAAARTVTDDRDTDPDELAANAMTAMLAAGESDRQVEFTSQSLMATTMERVDAASRGTQLGLPTGWRSLDDKLGGWHDGDLTIVAGRPGMGKSSFGLGAAVKAAALGARVGFVSVEMDAPSLGMRLTASQAGLSVSDLRRGRLADSDWSKLAQASNEIAALPLRVLDAPSWSISQIVRQCHVWHRGGLDMVVLDYLGRVRIEGKQERRDLAIGNIAKELKTLASMLHIPVMVLSQLSRSLESRQDKRPILSDLRDSGEIEQEADGVIMLYRDAEYNDDANENEGEVLVEKQRQGPVGMIEMRWDGPRTSWEDWD